MKRYKMQFGEAEYKDKPKLTLLIDADIDLYRIASLCMEEIIIDRMHTYISSQDKMEALLKTRWDEYMVETGASDIVIALSDYNGDKNFRKLVYPMYKENRRGTRKPLGYKTLREWVESNYTTYCKPTLEADDVLGILATNDEIVQGDKIIVSADKDLQTIPCTLWNPDKRGKPTVITEPMADFTFLCQTLTGDTTDNYKGCPKMGEKTAPVYLEKQGGDLWLAIVKAYEKQGQTEHDALANARCAKILRNEDYNWDTETIKLWSNEDAERTNTI